MWFFIHKRFKGSSNSADPSCRPVTLAFSLQVAAWQHWHSCYKSPLSDIGVLATSCCSVTLVFSLLVAARWHWHSRYKSLLSDLVTKALSIKITNLSVRVPQHPLVAAAQPGHPQLVPQPAGPANAWPQVLPSTDSTGRQSQQAVHSAVPLGLPAGEGIIECSPLREELLLVVTFVWRCSLLLRMAVVVDRFYIALFSSLEQNGCCWSLLYSAVLHYWE